MVVDLSYIFIWHFFIIIDVEFVEPIRPHHHVVQVNDFITTDMVARNVNFIDLNVCFQEIFQFYSKLIS